MITKRGDYTAPELQCCELVVERGYSVSTVVNNWEMGSEYEGSAD